MQVVATGAYGQLGRELCRQLGSNAVPFDIDTLDITDAAAVLDTLSSTKADAVINCSAYTQVDRAEKDAVACRAVNATAVGYLVQACKALDCPLVQISTDYVFGGEPDRTTPYREVEQTFPRSVYAKTKFEGEQIAAQHKKHLIVRTCGLYARATEKSANNFVKTMLRLGCEQDEIRVVADQHCTPSYVPHVARAILSLVGMINDRPAPWGVYHVTNRGATTWYEFAAEIFRQAGVAVKLKPITTAEYDAAAVRPAYSVLNTEKYHSLGGPAMPDWKAALSEYIDTICREI